MLKRESTRTTPYVFFDPVNGIFVMKGCSSPQSALDFYQPILERLEALLHHHRAIPMSVEFAMEYFNTSSSKCIFHILKMLEKISRSAPVKVVWAYEMDDDDLLEIGQDLSEMLELDFEFKPL